MSLRSDRALLALEALPVDDWGPEHWDTFEAARADLRAEFRAARRRLERSEQQRERSGRPPLRRSRLRPVSDRRRGEAARRALVREYVLERDGGCVPAERGMPGLCGTLPGRPSLEVHEIAARGTHPGSHLDVDLCVATCPKHHEMVTNATGDLLALARDLDLRRKPTT